MEIFFSIRQYSTKGIWIDGRAANTCLIEFIIISKGRREKRQYNFAAILRYLLLSETYSPSFATHSSRQE